MDSRTDDRKLSALKKAIVEIRTLRARLEEAERVASEPIAVVGYALRFPGADGAESFWRLLAEGRDGIREIPRDRWDVDAFYAADPDAAGKMYTREGGFLENVDLFDPRFFGISPREAESMDPQHRLMLEVAWEALEDAGVPAPSLLESPTGVFIGISNCDYGRRIFSDVARIDTYASIGTNFSVVAGRLSYLLGLQGPSVALDTACSSSLVAVHLACRSLRSGESRMAIAGGVNLILSPEVHINFCKAGMLAKDGRCKTFDAAADGYVRGEGCGAVVLKRLSDALRDGDRVHALVRGSAVNQDGRSSGLTAPNGPSQEAVIRAALADARLDPDALDYVEAHGTGTSLGDPIEVGALGAVVAGRKSPDRPLWIGSVKSNFGHLEAAAGIAGMIKVIEALGHGSIPRSLHFRTPNPHIDWGRWPVRVAAEAQPWTRGERPRTAGVSSFGFSGTNAHLILGEAPVPEESVPAVRPWHLVTVSGKSSSGLRAAAGRLAARLEEEPVVSLADVAYTANACRTHHAERGAVLASTREAAADGLARLARGDASPEEFQGRVDTGTAPEVVFLFPGQGPHYYGMARELYDTCVLFREHIEECDAILRGEMPLPLIDVLYGNDPDPINATLHAQPALFAVETGLARVWQSWGVRPAAVMGHSAGEYAAACAAGAMSLADGLRLIAARGRLMHSLPPGGAMAAVRGDAARVQAALRGAPGALTIAAYNGPSHFVLSGEKGALEAFLASLEGSGIEGKMLRISIASHCPLLDPILDEYEAVAKGMAYKTPGVELISNLTGAPLGAGGLDAAYWRRHARSPVLFQQGVAALERGGYRIFLEAGPGSTSLGMAQETMPAEGRLFLPSIRRKRPDWQQMLETAALLHVGGVPLRWSEMDRPFARGKISLPAYPFQRERYWFESGEAQPAPARTRWEAVVSAGREQAAQGPLDLAVASFAGKWAALEKLAGAYEWSALDELGAFREAAGPVDAETLLRKTGISRTYAPLLRLWLETLAGSGYLTRAGEGFVPASPSAHPPLRALLAEAETSLGDYRALFDYVCGCGGRLAAVLTGKESPLETLFPGGSFDVANGLYRDSPVARYLNAIARSVVGAAVANGGPSRDVRILEIGAGTGGTTSALLPALPPGKVEYDFTDVSDLFLSRARDEFSRYPFVRYRRYDAEKDPAAQGIGAGEYDLVVAANVLHATKDLRATLNHVRSVLAPGGVLVMVETVTHHRVFEITTGLIEGWQRFGDGIRGDHPLLSSASWLDLLAACGFEAAAAFPEPGGVCDVLGNAVIAAAVAGDPAARRAGERKACCEGEGSDAEPGPAAGAGAAVSGIRAEAMRAHPEERKVLLAELSRSLIMEILRIGEKQKPGLNDRLMELGFDSLMAVQLRNRLASVLSLSTRLPATIVFEHPTCHALGAYLSGLLGTEEKAAVAPAAGATGPAPPAAPDDIDNLSESEAEERLLRRLETIEVKK